MSSDSYAFAPGSRVLIRGEEWLVKRVETNSLGNTALHCKGISRLVKDREAIFLSDLDEIIPVDPAQTHLVCDESSFYRDSRLYLESQLRRRAPTDNTLHVGHKAAMDSMTFQLEPAYKALKKPRQRILIADTVGLGKTLEAGILMSELIARGKGRRILVVTSKSMMAQFQMEMWNRFTIPLVSLDSAKIKRIRAELPSNANPFFYYDKAIVSVDTIKRGVEYGVHLENAYWDIIVIDEAQNVAERGTQSAQRSKLAQKLSTRSDTLIMLSATPHDGRPKSFASLMNMLDPTAIADPDNYTADDVRDLFVRRFKKDVRQEVSGTFLERDVQIYKKKASAAEERAFDIFADMQLQMDVNKAGTSSGLFKISLEKALFSSPAACIQSIEERLKKLERTDPYHSTGDARTLNEFKEAVAAIGPQEFSRYQGLLDLLRSSEYGWNPDASDDRLVIFTERIATMKWLAEQLMNDMNLSESAVRTMDGSMSDIDQQQLVTEFGTLESPVRVLVASDVASEGINLHYLSHRLIHFDTPWSLMVFQQRNGRVDRYGQQKQPLIRFMATECTNERIRGDLRILEILIEKEKQANANIGDPAMLMGKYSIDAEEQVIQEIIAKGANEKDFERTLNEPAFDLLAALMGNTKAETEGQVPTTEDKTLLSNLDYLTEGLNAFGTASGVKEKHDLSDMKVAGLRLHLEPGSELAKRYRTTIPEANMEDGVVVLSPDAKFCMKEAERCRSTDFELGKWPQAQYLWQLHPIFDWLNDKASMELFKRDEAPVIGVSNLTQDTCLFFVQGTIPNKKSTPVVDEWFGLQYENGTFVKQLTFNEVLALTSINDVSLPNTRAVNQAMLETAETLCPDVVNHAQEFMQRCYKDYCTRVNPQIDAEIDKLNNLEKKHMDVQLSLFLGQRQKNNKQREIEHLFDSYTEWVSETLEIQNNPNIKIQAAFIGVA